MLYFTWGYSDILTVFYAALTGNENLFSSFLRLRIWNWEVLKRTVLTLRRVGRRPSSQFFKLQGLTLTDFQEWRKSIPRFNFILFFLNVQKSWNSIDLTRVEKNFCLNCSFCVFYSILDWRSKNLLIDWVYLFQYFVDIDRDSLCGFIGNCPTQGLSDSFSTIAQ